MSDEAFNRIDLGHWIELKFVWKDQEPSILMVLKSWVQFVWCIIVGLLSGGHRFRCTKYSLDCSLIVEMHRCLPRIVQKKKKK
jgi:hypothetical protein